MNYDILFVITRGDDIGGANIHVRDLSLWLKEKGLKVAVLTGTRGIFNKILEENNIDNYYCKHLKREINFFSDVYFIFWFWRFSLKLNPRLISSHSSKAGLLCRISCYFFKIAPCIFTAHGWSFTDGINFISKNIYVNLERIVGVFSDFIITVCESDLNLALRKKIIDFNKISCVHNGMKYIDAPKRELVDKQLIRIISIARFNKQKDHLTLIKALALIKNLNWQLVLVGSGPKKEHIIALTKKYNLESKVIFLGLRQDIHQLLLNSDIFVLSSLWEGFPRSIIEAMRASMPLVATNVGGVKESVRDNINGFTFKRKDSNELSEHIKYLIENPSLIKSFGEASRKIFEDEFTFNLMARKTLKIYSKFIKLD